MSVPNSRLISIDFLRGCAALGVVIAHSYPLEPANLAQQYVWFNWLRIILGQGTLGVPLFFVISGFCIHLRWTQQYARTGETKTDFIDFWKRRIHRLYPPYLVVLCFCMLMVLVAFFLGRSTYYPEPKLRWIGLDFAAHLLMLHGFHPLLDNGGGNPAMWTLAREEYFYILYFGLLAWRLKWKLPTTVFGVLGLGLAFPFMMRLFVPPDSYYWPTVYTSAIVLWIQWVLGMVAVEAYYGLIKLPRWCYAGWMIPVWFVAAKVSSYYLGNVSLIFSLLVTVFYGMLFFTLVNFCIDAEASSSWSKHRITVWLANVGLFSYSLYLVHYPVNMILRELFGVIAPPSNVWIAMGEAVVKVVVAFYAAKLFFNLVERRFLNTSVRFRSLKPAADDDGKQAQAAYLTQPNK
jgi:peptidoglycan/LPS O-acetylase OafA/YrhL